MPLQKYVKRSCQKVHCSCISSRSAAFTLHSLHSWPHFLLCTSWLTDFSSSILLALFLTTRRLNSFLNSVEKSSFFSFRLLSLKWSYRWPSDAASLHVSLTPPAVSCLFQIVPSVYDVVRLCAPSSSLILDPLFFLLLEVHGHHPFCKSTSFCICPSQHTYSAAPHLCSLHLHVY